MNELIVKCEQYGLENFCVNSDGTIDVNGDVNLYIGDMIELPVNFGEVTGNFVIYGNNLRSLFGCPKEVGGDFVCKDSNLTSLEYSPTEVKGNYYCDNNELVSLAGCPSYIGGNFYCNDNVLSSLVGAPEEVGGDFYAFDNQLQDLKGSPRKVGGDFHVAGNPLVNLTFCPLIITKSLYVTDSLPSLFSGQDDCRVGVSVELLNQDPRKIITRLPQKVIDNHKKLHIILKYQQYFDVWDIESGEFIEENFDILIYEINDGLL